MAKKKSVKVPNTNQQLKQLVVKDLKFDQYQDSRKKSAVAWTKRTKSKFDPAKLGVIDVSYRNRTYWVVDGMARVLLSKEVGATHIWAVVNKGLTYEEEALRFVVLNKERRKTTPYQEFYGEYEAKDPFIISIVKLARKYGFDVLKEIPGADVLRCHSLLRQIAAGPNGLAVLENTFRVLRTCWAGYSNATNTYLLRGLGFFLAQHDDVPGLVDRLMTILPVVTPESVLHAAHMRRSGYSGNGGYRDVYAVLLGTYNRDLTVKLPSRLRATPSDKNNCEREFQQTLVDSLNGSFKRGGQGATFLFRKGGKKVLSNRLKEALGDVAAERFAGPKAASMVRAYIREERSRFSPQMAVVCERRGVPYQDVLLKKRKTSKKRKKSSNGRSKKKIKGEVIFDATSSLSVLEQKLMRQKA